MFSGKTTRLLKELSLNKSKYSETIVAKWDLDRRAGGNIETHDGLSYTDQVNSVHTLDAIEINKKNESVLVAVDESQFFGRDLLRLWDRIYKRQNKDALYVAGLDLDFRKHKFGLMTDLIEHVYSINPALVEIHSLCSTCYKCGGKAPFTMRTFDDDEQILVGGSSIYVPSCALHHKLPSKKLL